MFTPGWKNSKKQLPTVGISVLIYVPDDSAKPFYIAKLIEKNDKKIWFSNTSIFRCRLFFPLEKVSRWMLIPLFGGFGCNEKEIRIMPLNSDYRFELIDFEE